MKQRQPLDILNEEVHNKAKITAMLSFAVYDDKVAQNLRKQKFQAVKFIDIDNAQCVCCFKDNVPYVVFRGTEPDKISDILADLNIKPVDSKLEGWVHEGFRDEVLKLEDEILKWITKNSIDGKNIIVSGHSLGAAMSVIFASRLGADKVHSVYTYGCPRPGGKSFMKKFNESFTHYRFVNNNDIVCRVPPAPFYRQTGQCIYFDYSDNCYHNPSFWKTLTGFFGGVWTSWKRKIWFDSASDHSMDKYVYLVDNALDDFI